MPFWTLKTRENRLRPASAPDPTGEAYSAPQTHGEGVGCPLPPRTLPPLSALRPRTSALRAKVSFASWLTCLKSLRSQWSTGHRPNVAILICLVQQLPPVSSSSHCPVFLCPSFVSMCFWVFLSCDVHLASGRKNVLVYMFHLFVVCGQTISIFFCLTELIRWGTGIRGLMWGMANLPQGNQELLVVRDKVGRPQVSLG